MTHDLLLPVVSPLRDDIRLHALDKPVRRVLVENVDRVHAAQGEQHALAVFLTVDRAAVALQPAHRLVAIQANDQILSQRARLFKVLDVADVKDVEAAVGED